MRSTNPILHCLRPLLAAACLPLASGCTSAITTAYLRDTLWQFSEHAAEETPDTAATAGGPASAGNAGGAGASTTAADAARKTAAIEEAVGRLSRIGTLDAVTRGVLVETLERTQPEDWPVVVETFAESLQTAAPQPETTETPEPVTDRPAARPTAHTVAKTAVDRGPPEAVPPAAESETPPASTAAGTVMPAAAPPAAPPAPPVIAAEPVPKTPAEPPPRAPAEPTAAPVATGLAIRNACFASRVQAWGVVDRFASHRFRPGQDLIVYFELDNLAARAGEDGHTTCIDTSLRLLGPDGGQIHAWSFEPIAETCAARRRDYFARYVLRIPETATPGPCALDIGVRDTLGETTATATLPLVIAAE